jgi:hypothetical protein
VDQTTHPRLSRARPLIDLQRWAEAATELRAVLATDPESVTALCLLAQCQLGLEEPEAACTTAELAMRADPDDEPPIGRSTSTPSSPRPTGWRGLAIAELSDLLDASWPRLLLGSGCIAGWAVVVGRWLSRLPTQVRRHLRGVGRRFDRHDHARFWGVAVPTALLFLGTTFLPAGVALPTGAGVVALFLAGRSGRIPGMQSD